MSADAAPAAPVGCDDFVALSETGLARLDEAAINASAPPQQRWVDGWLVRFSPGKAKRARCIQPVAPGRLPVADKLALCRPVYRTAGLPLLVRVSPFSEPQGLDALLERLGMPAQDDTRVMVCRAPQAATSPRLPAGLQWSSVGHEAFAQAVGVLRGSPLAQRQAHAERLVYSPVPFSAVLLRRGTEVLACGQVALEGSMAGVYDVFTAPAERGRGLARLLCSHLLAQSAARGARVAYLQVEADNAPARAVYRALAFEDAYAYHYRVDPQALP